MSECCDNCKFHIHVPVKDVHMCRRYPPVLFISHGVYVNHIQSEFTFPTVKRKYWCGEYMRREE